jgi:phage terminase large subunit-like protein
VKKRAKWGCNGRNGATAKAGKAAAAWRDIDAIVGLWGDPTTDRAFWERVWCNRLVQSSSQAFDVEKFKTLMRPSPVEPGDMIALGFDGSMFHDATALVAIHLETGYQWVAGIWECPPGRDDWQVPAEDVDATVRDLFERFDVWRMYADPPYWQPWIAAWQGVFGKDRVVEWFTNRRRPMMAALEAFHSAIREGTIAHDGNAALVRHIANARRDELEQRDEQGKKFWLIRKERPDSPKKMDLAMAAVLSWEARNDAIAAGVVGRSVYESRGILVL